MTFVLLTHWAATVCSLCAMPVDSAAADTVTVTAIVREYKLEQDGDIHLVLADNDCTMIAEIAPGTPAMKAFRASHKVTSRFRPLGDTLTITGVLFYDHEHGQRGVAPNAIELHPVVEIR